MAHTGYFRRETVTVRKWLSESQFARLLALCQFLPGPASSQLGFALGLRRAGWAGAIAAFVAFTLPSALLLYAAAGFLPEPGSRLGTAVVSGLKLAACVMVLDALAGMSRSLCPGRPEQLLASASAIFLLIFGSAFLQLLLVFGGALAGMLFLSAGPPAKNDALQLPADKRLGWLLPGILVLLLLCPLLLPETDAVKLAGVFLSTGALVFGGGHVVLPLLEERLVTPGWISQDMFLAGYGAAQTVPGPLFTFAAYLGAVIPTGLAPWMGALLALLCIFLPGLLLLASVLPFWQQLTANPLAGRALAGVNACVVGFLAASFYEPVFTGSVHTAADLATVVAGFAMVNLMRWSPLAAVACCLLSKLAW